MFEATDLRTVSVSDFLTTQSAEFFYQSNLHRGLLHNSRLHACSNYSTVARAARYLCDETGLLRRNKYKGLKAGTVNTLKWLSEDALHSDLSHWPLRHSHLRWLNMKSYISGIFDYSRRVVDTVLRRKIICLTPHTLRVLKLRIWLHSPGRCWGLIGLRSRLWPALLL